MYDTSTLVLTRIAVQRLKIPVVTGGGFADAAGFVTALALGADGLLMGTRFMATKECPAHPKFKEWLLRSKEDETIITQRSTKLPARSLINGPSLKVLEMEQRGTTLQELMPIISGENTRRVYFDGDLEAGMAECGQIVGLINDIPTVKELIDGIIQGAEEIIKKQLYPLVKNS
jgi:nitronate monooxygenase